MNNNKGVVLIMVLWVLLVLALIVWGLGRRSSMEVSLMETYQGKLRSYAAARAGVNTLLDMMQRTPSTKDTLYASGIAFDQTKSPEDVFGHIDTGDNTYAMVQWLAQNYNTSNNTQLVYGLRDVAGKININAINASNYEILSALLQIYGSSQSDADKLTMAILNFSGANANAVNSSFLTLNEDEGLKPKNKHYENILELMEVSGMTKDIFDKIKNDVTVYGDDQNGLWINTDTADNNVIQAVANAAVRLNPSANAASIVSEAVPIRDGADAVSFTADDGVGSVSTVNDTNWPPVLQEGLSNYYEAHVVGIDDVSKARTVLDVVIHHAPGTPGEIISWQRDAST